MTAQLELLRYPAVPGSKRPGTSAEAGEAMKCRAKTLRASVLAVLARHEGTTDEIADELGESVLAIRPRFSELHRLGQITETGERRRNRSGKFAMVWRALDV